MDCGNPYRAVPRVTTSELSTRSSTGTRIGDGIGGAVSAAISAGDLILDPAIQLTAAARATNASTRMRVKIRFLLTITFINWLLCPQFSLNLALNWVNNKMI